MEPTEVPNEQMQPQVAPIQTQQQQQQPENLNTVKGLAIAQLAIGAVSGILGITAVATLYKDTWTTNTGAGMWAGGWIGFAGLMGLFSARNRNLNAAYMIFSIIATCVSGLCGIFCICALVWYDVGKCHIEHDEDHSIYWDCSHWQIGLAVYGTLLAFMIMEFFVSIIAAVYCRRCGVSQHTQNVVFQPYVVSGGNATSTTPTLYAPQPPLYNQQVNPMYDQQVKTEDGQQVNFPNNELVSPHEDNTQPPPVASDDTSPEKGSFSYQKFTEEK